MEKKIPGYLLETGESFEQKYQPVLDFEGWRIAMLRFSLEHDKNHLEKVERHNETNEVFILTEGEADMIICENGNTPGETYVFPMRKNVAYNIQKAVWHNVAMSPNAHIILVEKTDTTVENSDYFFFSNEEFGMIKEKCRDF